MKCPHCSKEIEVKVDSASLEYIDTGWKMDCPECGGPIVLRRYVKNPARGRPKHVSKKERRRMREGERG